MSWSHRTLAAAVAAVLCGGAVSSAQTFDLVVGLIPLVTGKGVLTVSVNGREACRLEVAGSASDPAYCRAPLPRDTRQLAVEWNPSARLVPRKQRQFTVFSVADLTNDVRQAPPAASMGRLVQHVDALLAAIESDDRADDLGVTFEPKASAEALAAAETRLGFPLDPELVRLLKTTGGVRFGDSWMVRPDEFDRTDRQFRSVWGHPETVAPPAAAIYESSTMVWVEAGDGYGAVIYQPRGPARCGDGPAYWRIHQESVDDPELITTAEGACGGLRHALFPMFLRDVLEQIDDRRAEEQLLVDASVPAFTTWLRLERDGRPRLSSAWDTLR